MDKLRGHYHYADPKPNIFVKIAKTHDPIHESPNNQTKWLGYLFRPHSKYNLQIISLHSGWIDWQKNKM